MADMTSEKVPAYDGGPPPGHVYPRPGQVHPPPGQVYPPPTGVANQPPPPAYYPHASQPNTAVVVTPGYVIAQQPIPVTVNYGQSPVRIRCPHCSQDVVTHIEYMTGSLTWLVCLAACVMGCFLGCCLIPFCVDAAKDVIHKCPNCEQQVGVYRRL